MPIWMATVVSAFMVAGLLFVFDIMRRVICGYGCKRYFVILPVYWAAFYLFIKFM